MAEPLKKKAKVELVKTDAKNPALHQPTSTTAIGVSVSPASSAIMGDKAHTAAPCIGDKGVSELKKLLAKSNPQNAVPAFQKRNGLQINGAEAALLFLSLMGVKRFQACSMALDVLLDTLLAKLQSPSMSVPSLLELLDRSFGFLSNTKLKRIPEAVLLKLGDDLPQSYIKRLNQDQEVLETLPLSLQRRCWEIFPKPCFERVQQLIQKYVSDKTRVQAANQYFPASVLLSKMNRKQDADLNGMIDLLGTSWELYKGALVLIRKTYVDTGDVLCAALRLDLMLAMQDRGVSWLKEKDACFQFAQDLSVAVLEGQISSVRQNSLQAFLAQIPTSHPVSGEVALLCLHSSVRNLLFAELFSALAQVQQNNGLPRENEKIQLTVQLLELSGEARAMWSAKKFGIGPASSVMLRYVLPRIIGLMVWSELGDLTQVFPVESLLPFFSPSASLSPAAASSASAAKPIQDQKDNTQVSSSSFFSSLSTPSLFYFLLLQLRDHNNVIVGVLINIFTNPTPDLQDLLATLPSCQPVFWQSLLTQLPKTTSPKHPEIWRLAVEGWLLPLAQKSPSVGLSLRKCVSELMVSNSRHRTTWQRLYKALELLVATSPVINTSTETARSEARGTDNGEGQELLRNDDS
eukprot:gb/GEZN01004319.1/.p1 GENE.gb/GEZN01004319.1/~~gb/GEZN01004319.1/.p1  ORF type:complete len:633 (-),score=116.49 gb/GEZN01004319.1/:19-1917(-)